ncbi:MAG: hypothetical protein Q7U52_07935 [Hydrogenophaga sp.]|uniref:hypothetical protein n=1 Tax=Hydrogenophaga sp. TaxID=1904254 RepID=UPI0027171A26|nr:hypothetical protein [Hydrogenophaga sp.]MDO9147579.1 hypothetical protein [Hydrogenophaga sp.]MDO9605632.1 hypothetical protein [Hydrogenophaga sp.]
MMDREQMDKCMEQVRAYRASGMKAKVWAEASGVPLGMLGSWCAHYARWQARLDGSGAITGSAPSATRPTGFVAARVAPPGAGTGAAVRIEIKTGMLRLDLHWPLAHTTELATLLSELSR